MRSKLVNPFITTGYHGVDYFCDRQKETLTLLNHMKNGRSVTLTSIRRIGKTGLIKHTLSQLPSDSLGIYLDILPTENLKQFFDVLVTEIVNHVPEKQSYGRRILDFVKSLRPTITYDPLTGQPQVTIDVLSGETIRHIGAVFSLLEQSPKKVIIAIDEFQQILNYPEKQTDSWLRSVIQTLNNVHFIFAGSQQHLMSELFADPGRPFYRSTSFLRIGKISEEAYAHFIQHHFSKAGRKISEETVHEMLQWTDLHTYYVQLLCNRVFASNAKEIHGERWREEALRLLQEQEIVFFKYRDLLTTPQWMLLKSLASEGVLRQPTAKDFIAQYKLGSPSTVLRSLQALSDKAMIYSDYDANGHLYYSVYDLLFRRWMERQPNQH
jgi:uncharacterized protein